MFNWIGICGLTFFQEVLIIVYTRGLVEDSVPIWKRISLVMLVTVLLALIGYTMSRVVVFDSSMIVPATIGHAIGVPVGMLVPLASSRKSRPKAE